MDYAADLFAERGYHPTSVADIVDGVGAGKGVFYWYFESKEELFLEILREAHLDLRRAQRAAIGDEADPMRRIELGIRSSFAWIDGNRQVFSLLQVAAVDARLVSQLRTLGSLGSTSTGDLAQHIGDAVVQGLLPEAKAAMLTQAILGVMNQLTVVFVLGGTMPMKDVADAAVAFCLGGLAAARLD
jgi:AcrR family transcriptional regulator